MPILVGLDREILDRPPDREDELPTMLHQGDQREKPAGDTERAAAQASPPAKPQLLGGTPSRPTLASDDVS